MDEWLGLFPTIRKGCGSIPALGAVLCFWESHFSSHFLTSSKCKWIPVFGWGRLKAMEGEDWAPVSDTVP